VQGEIHEAQGDKHAAIESYDKSIQIDTALQKKLSEQPQ
jgi:predicted negative regulator of RcsB-dependent stress response